MTITLSAKGQLVIPRAIRKALALKPGTKFEIAVTEQTIVLTPLPDRRTVDEVIAALYGKFAGDDMLERLETEHRWEIERDAKRCA